MFRKFGNYGA